MRRRRKPQWHCATGRRARVLYRHLLELAPDDIGIKTNFAVALMNGEGDFAAARAIFETIPYPRYDARGQPIWDDLFPRFRLLMLERDYAGAERLLADFPLEEFPGPVPGLKNIFFALTAWAKGDQHRARELFEKVRRDWEPLVREHPDDPTFTTGSVCFMPTSAGRKRHCERAAEPLISSQRTTRSNGLHIQLILRWRMR